jgi:hypothetical protein
MAYLHQDPTFSRGKQKDESCLGGLGFRSDLQLFWTVSRTQRTFFRYATFSRTIRDITMWHGGKDKVTVEGGTVVSLAAVADTRLN